MIRWIILSAPVLASFAGQPDRVLAQPAVTLKSIGLRMDVQSRFQPAQLGILQPLPYRCFGLAVQESAEIPPSGGAMPQDVSTPQFTDLTDHRLNRVLHFALELGVWTAFGAWGYDQGDGASRYAPMVGLPLATIVTWTVFGVRDDPWRPGGRGASQPRIPVPGWTRFAYEMAVHGLAAWAFESRGWTPATIGMVSGTLVHYAVSYQRVAWLLGLRRK